MQVEVAEGERGFLVTGSTCQEALRGGPRPKAGLKDLRLWLEVEAEEVKHAGSVPASLDAELADLRCDPADRRFVTVGMVCKQVAFLRVQHEGDVPSRLVSRFLAPAAPKRFASRWADRVLPVDWSVHPKADSFKRLAKDALLSHAGRPWRLLYEPFRGGWNTISKEDALEACKENLGVDYHSVAAPEITVVCTVQPRFVGLAVVDIDTDYLRVEDG
ncbi:unnamed protein product [Effrenium voratum]|uniref:Uncharacterized protein n=1 Tax=Effrenium voratum TaxID=2562239 RepID=A0AA36HW48_9DINO|nr:unnamed protein product [Effrenium voratum]